MHIHPSSITGFIISGLAALQLMQGAVSAQCGRLPAGEASGSLSEEEMNNLRFMHEEEKMARDVYRALDAEWNRRVFRNISRAEQRHFDATGFLLKRYGQETSSLEVGRYADAKLQALHDSLLANGKKSVLDGLKTGALIEEVDIGDLQQAISRTDCEDLRIVYGNLLAASGRHLKAFVFNIEALGDAPYTARHLPQAEVDGILGR